MPGTDVTNIQVHVNIQRDRSRSVIVPRFAVLPKSSNIRHHRCRFVVVVQDADLNTWFTEEQHKDYGLVHSPPDDAINAYHVSSRVNKVCSWCLVPRLRERYNPRMRTAGSTTVLPRKPHPVDVHVGARIRLRRNTLGMSQQKLASALGITFQQVQKYERGTNRVGASRLWHIAQLMKTPVAFFFEDAPGDPSPEQPRAVGPSDTDRVLEFLSSPQGLRLNRAFVGIGDPKIRDRLVKLASALAV